MLAYDMPCGTTMKAMDTPAMTSHWTWPKSSRSSSSSNSTSAVTALAQLLKVAGSCHALAVCNSF